MDRKLAALITFVILFVIVFIYDHFINKRNYLRKINGKKKNKNNSELIEIAYLNGKFKIDKNELRNKKILLFISFINSFIISLVAVVVLLLNINTILQLVIGFILLLLLIYAFYEILGNYLVKRSTNNGK